MGVCRGCGAYTQPRNGEADAYTYCNLPSRRDQAAMDRRAGLDTMQAWRELYGRLPTSYDWSRTHARRRGGEALARLAGWGMAAFERRH